MSAHKHLAVISSRGHVLARAMVICHGGQGCPDEPLHRKLWWWAADLLRRRQ